MNTRNINEASGAGHRHLQTREALRSALIDLVNSARNELALVTPMLDNSSWNSAAMGEALRNLLTRGSRHRTRIVVEDTEFMLTACPRLVELARRFSDLILIRRLGEPHRGLNEMFALADRDSCLAQPDVGLVDATLDLAAPAVAAPYLQRFEEIWAAAEPAPGLHGFRL
jgi:hypothetical protein